MDFHKNPYVRDQENRANIISDDLDITPQEKIVNHSRSYSQLESQEGEPSPSIVMPNSSRMGVSPETPENY